MCYIFTVPHPLSNEFNAPPPPPRPLLLLIFRIAEHISKPLPEIAQTDTPLIMI